MQDDGAGSTIAVSMAEEAPWQIEYGPGGRELLAAAALDLTRVFDDARIRVWRDLPERQNCVLDADAAGVRLHIKRYRSPHGADALVEQRGIQLLERAGIASVPLVAVGVHPDGRGFMVTRDLVGMQPADKVLATHPEHADRIADLAKHLHEAHLHHRDLYLCHFMLKPDDASQPIHLIDAGRVARMPRWPAHFRWVVKDLAQLLYSVEDAPLPMTIAEEMLSRYLQGSSAMRRSLIRVAVKFKVASIRRHDKSLRRKRPGRRVSIDSLKD